MNIEDITKSVGSRLERIRVQNALNPMLWLAVAVPIIFLPAALLFRDYSTIIVGALVTLACLPTLVTILAYIYLLFRSPDRLQSEEYQLHLREINLRYRQHRRPDRYNKANQPVEYLDSHARIENGEQE